MYYCSTDFFQQLVVYNLSKNPPWTPELRFHRVDMGSVKAKAVEYGISCVFVESGPLEDVLSSTMDCWSDIVSW